MNNLKKVQLGCLTNSLTKARVKYSILHINQLRLPANSLERTRLKTFASLTNSSDIQVSTTQETFSKTKLNLIRKILSLKNVNLFIGNQANQGIFIRKQHHKVLPTGGGYQFNNPSSTNPILGFENPTKKTGSPTQLTNTGFKMKNQVGFASSIEDEKNKSRYYLGNRNNSIKTKFFLNKIYQKQPRDSGFLDISSSSTQAAFGLINYKLTKVAMAQISRSQQLNLSSRDNVTFNQDNAVSQTYFLKNKSQIQKADLQNKKYQQQKQAERVFHSSYSKMTEINLITISLASANRIRQWAEKTLPNGKVVGEVINPETVHYKTLKPIKGGLFCERIFGPLKDHECACGKKFNIQNYLTKERDITLSQGVGNNLSLKQVKLQKRYFCRVCDVEYTYSIIRRTQLGYIQLASPTTHVWFVKGIPSYISILLDMKKKHLQNVTYNSQTLTLEHSFRGRQFLPSSPSSIFESWQKIMKSQYPEKYGEIQGIKKESTLNKRRNQNLDPTNAQKKQNQFNLLTKERIPTSLNKKSLYKQNKKVYYSRTKPSLAGENKVGYLIIPQLRASDVDLRASKLKLAGLQSSLNAYRSSTNSLLGLGPNGTLPSSLPVTNLRHSTKKQKKEELNMSEQLAYQRSFVHQKKGWFKLAYNLLQIKQKAQRQNAQRNWLTVLNKINGSYFSQLTGCNNNKLNRQKKNIYLSKQNDLQLLVMLLLNEFNSTINEEFLTKFLKFIPSHMSAVFNFCLKNSFLTSTNPTACYKQELLNLALQALRYLDAPSGKLLNLFFSSQDLRSAASEAEGSRLKIKTKIPIPLYLLFKAKNQLALDVLRTKLFSFRPKTQNDTTVVNVRSLRFDMVPPQEVTPKVGLRYLYTPIVWRAPSTNPNSAIERFVNLPLPFMLTQDSKSTLVYSYLNCNSNTSYTRSSLYFSQQLLNYSIFKAWKILIKLNSQTSCLLGTLEQRASSSNKDIPHNALPFLLTQFLKMDDHKLTLKGVLASLQPVNVTVSSSVFANNLKTLISSDLFKKQILNSLFKNKNNISNTSFRGNEGGTDFNRSDASLFKAPSSKVNSNLHKRAFWSLIKSLKSYNLNKFEKQTTKLALMLLLNLTGNAFDQMFLNNLQLSSSSGFQSSSKQVIKSTGLRVLKKDIQVSPKHVSNTIKIFNRIKNSLQTKILRQLYIWWYFMKQNKQKGTMTNGNDQLVSLTKTSKVLTRYFYFIKQNKKIIVYKLYKSLTADFEVTKNKFIKYMFILKTFFSYRNMCKTHSNLESNYLVTENIGESSLQSKYQKINFVNLSLNFIKTHNQRKKFFLNKPSFYFKKVKLWNPDNQQNQQYLSAEKTRGVKIGLRNLAPPSEIRKKAWQNLKPHSLGTYTYTRGVTDLTEGGMLALSIEGFNQSSIVNNIYCLSHRELWEQDKDWQDFAYYYYSPTNITDIAIPLYKNRNFDLFFNMDNSFASTAGDYLPGNQINNMTSVATQEALYEGQKVGTQFPAGRSLLSEAGMNINTSFSGAGLIQKLLNDFNYTELKKMDKQNRILLFEYNKHVKKLKKMMNSRLMKSRLDYYKACHIRDVLIRRTKLTRKIFNKVLGSLTTVSDRERNISGPSTSTSVETNGLNMILTLLPVLPPVLRPVLKMSGQFTISDLNRLYQRIIYRNERLKKFLKDPALSSSFEMKYAQRLLQEAVDNLIQNGKSGVVPEKDARGRLLKSLSDVLKGKQGRFRQYLLGKRVDYSGRSVIVVGPRLKLHECGIPKEMALVLYSPFLIKRILNQKLADTYLSAKKLIQTNPLLVSQLLREIMKSCPVLLNRAPTLHRLGFQAFQPKLVDGKAILLHPLVCPAFNADFDGDQMAVHVPITFEARAEAWKLMLARNNLLSPATGDPIILPSQDMVLGCYYLTTNCAEKWSKFKKGSGMYFHSINDVLKAYNQQLIHVHAVIWVNIKGHIENGNTLEQPLEIRIPLTKYKLNNHPRKVTKVPHHKYTHLNYIEIYSKTHNFLLLKRKVLTDTLIKPLSETSHQEFVLSTSSINVQQDGDLILNNETLRQNDELTTKPNYPPSVGKNVGSHIAIVTNQIIRTTPGKILFNMIVKNAIEKRPALLSKYTSGTGLVKNKLISTFELETDNFFTRKSIKTN